MADILSQAEIDELLNALSSGTDPEPAEQEANDFSKVRVYDFKTANKFPKEQIRTLNIVFQTFAQLFSNQLTAILRVSCECEVLSIEELSFNELNNSLPIPVILAIYRMPPMDGSQIMAVSPEAAYMLINRLLGGSAVSSDSAKQFTEIELALVERILRQMMRTFDAAWEKVFDVDAQIERLETSPQFAQIVALNEPMAVISLSLAIGNESGLISVCLPHASVEPVAKQLNTRLWYSGAPERKASSQTEFITDKLVRTTVDLTAYFEDTPATVIDIINLHVGDVIRLNQRLSQPIMVKVQHIPKFRAKIGTSGSRYAVQVVDIIKEEIEDESFTG